MTDAYYCMDCKHWAVRGGWLFGYRCNKEHDICEECRRPMYLEECNDKENE